MAMVTCPGCNKIVNDTSGKCPNCGQALKAGPTDKSTPAGKLRMISSALITVSFVLMLAELFDIGKTYISGLLLGVGIFLHGSSQAKMVNDKNYIGRKKVMIIYIFGVVLFLAGAVYFYVDLYLM
jgi:uncharacterized paraquat-inducible protein A